MLYAHPFTSVGGAAHRLGVSYATAQRAIDNLTDAGLLEEITGRRRNRLYAAEKILHIAFSFGDFPVEDDQAF